MIREHLLTLRPVRDHGFRWRSPEVSRLEGLSDAVFGFAITLLVVSLEVPRTFAELRAMYGLPNFLAFAACFVLVVMIWYDQYLYFRRYGLDDLRTTVLNVALLFVVLFYVYPLKFLARTLFGFFLGVGGPVQAVVQPAEWRELMILYGVGWCAVYGIFVSLYAHAYRRREPLQLDAVERLQTRYTILDHAIMLGVGLLSLAIVVVGTWGRSGPSWAPMFAGMAFLLIAPAQFVQGTLRARARRRLEAQLAAERAGSARPIAGGGTSDAPAVTADAVDDAALAWPRPAGSPTRTS